MIDHPDAITYGELVVRNGKYRGTRIPLTVPATVIGSAERCDVKLTARRVGDVHALVTITNSGPTLRSWFPDETLVNGIPTTAAVLRDGDELQIGPCLFQLAWYAEDLVPLQPAALEPDEIAELRAQAAAVAAQQALLVEEEWQLREREHALNEQEAQLAAVLDEKHRQLAGLLAQLGDGREQYRLDKAAEYAKIAAEKQRLAKMSAHVAPLHRAARKQKKKARELYRNYVERIRRRAAAEREAIAIERLKLDREKAELESEVEGFNAESAEFDADVAETDRRLREAWDLVDVATRRAMADRAEADALLAAERESLARAAAEMASQHRALNAGRAAAEARVAEALAEVARLEHRAAAARAVLQDLERQRGQLPSTALATDAVPLDRKSDRSPAQLIADLQQRERDLLREKHQLAAANAELSRRYADLADERTVIAEQTATLSVARDLWRQDEGRVLADLESVARAVHSREIALEARDRELAAASRRRMQRERDLWELRLRLEGWQTALASREARFAADRDRWSAELDARRGHLERWENALQTLCRKWSAVRAADRATLHEEIAHNKAVRTAYSTKLANLDREKKEILTEVAKVAERALAAEQLATELLRGPHGPRAMKRLRVLRRAWERRFTQFLNEIETRREAAVAEQMLARERTALAHRSLIESQELRANDAEVGMRADAVRLAASRALDDRESALEAAQETRRLTERELEQARTEVDRVAAILFSGPELDPEEDFTPRLAARSAA